MPGLLCPFYTWLLRFLLAFTCFMMSVSLPANQHLINSCGGGVPLELTNQICLSVEHTWTLWFLIVKTNNPFPHPVPQFVCLIGQLPQWGSIKTMWDKGESGEQLAGALTVVLTLTFPGVVTLVRAFPHPLTKCVFTFLSEITDCQGSGLSLRYWVLRYTVWRRKPESSWERYGIWVCRQENWGPRCFRPYSCPQQCVTELFNSSVEI